MTTLSPFAVSLKAALTKQAFVPSPQVQQKLQAIQQAKQAQDPAAAQAGAPPQDPAAQGAPVDPAAGSAPAPAQGAPPPATLDDVMAGLEQLAQMIQQIPAQVSAANPAGAEAKKKSPAERMDAIEQQLSQLTGGAPQAGAAPAPEAQAAAPAPSA